LFDASGCEYHFIRLPGCLQPFLQIFSMVYATELIGMLGNNPETHICVWLSGSLNFSLEGKCAKCLISNMLIFSNI